MTQKRISLNLTPEQRAIVKAAIGRDGAVLELGVEELEERIAPLVHTPAPGGPIPIPYPNIASRS